MLCISPHAKLPVPNDEDYNLDPDTYDGEFFQEDGLEGRFEIDLSAFRDRGVPGPTSELSPRAPAQMGRCETEHEGGKAAGGRRA
jgi:hypothetical protein